MAPTCLARQAAGRESLQDWLVRLGIDVRSYILWYVELKTAWIEAIWPSFFVSEGPATLWLLTTLHLYKTACGIDYVPCEINYLKWRAFQLIIH